MTDTNYILNEIVNKDLIKFGEFTLKSGMKSNVYADLRNIASFPHLIQIIADKMVEDIDFSNIDVVCGVPYGAISIASYISLKYNKPLVIKRKEPKKHGLGKMVEGIYDNNSKCLLIEDVMTTGESLNETIEELENYNLIVEQIRIILDRGCNHNLVNKYNLKFYV